MWFAVSLLFRSEHLPEGDNSWLWEERIILIAATTDEEAGAVAAAIGENSEHEYKTSAETVVRWRFIQIERIFAIEGEIESGVEVFSRFLRQSEVESLLTPFE